MTCAEGAPPPLRARGKAGRRAQIELDTFGHLWKKKAPKSEPVAPSYPPGTLKSVGMRNSVQIVGLCHFRSDPSPKAVPERRKAVKLTHTGMVIRKLDTFPHLLTQKTPKSEPVAPSYPIGTLNNLLKKSDTFCQFFGELRVKAAQGRKTSVILTHTGMVGRKLDTFPHLLTQKAPKSEPVAPSYPLGTLNNLLKKSDTFCQFFGELRVKAAQGRKTSVKLTHTGMVIRKLDTFPHLLTQKAPKSEPVAPSYPPWTFGDLVGALWYENTKNTQKPSL